MGRPGPQPQADIPNPGSTANRMSPQAARSVGEESYGSFPAFMGIPHRKLDRYSHWIPSMGRYAADGMDEVLG